MRRPASVQVPHSAQYAIAYNLSTINEISRRHGRRHVVAWAIDQLSESYCNLAGLSGIQIKDFRHEPVVRDLTEGDVLARQRQAQAVLPGLCKTLRAGAA